MQAAISVPLLGGVQGWVGSSVASASKNVDAFWVQEPISSHGGAALLRSPNIRATRQRRPTKWVSRFMGSENLHEMNANRDLEALMGGATLCGALIQP